MPSSYRSERAMRPNGDVSWVVVDDVAFELHVEASTFLASLRARDLSVNTERVYAGRVALFLSYCAERDLSWSAPSFMGLKGFQDWLVSEPLPQRGRGLSVRRFRSPGTANAVMTSVCEFLRFGVTQGWVSARTASMLSNPRLVRFLPPGYDSGEDGQFRLIASAVFRFRQPQSGIETFSDEQIERILGLSGRARDRFLVLLLAATGMRVGEALGLRREDMHLLAGSRTLGCGVAGPHVHVRRRHNANRALAKSRYPRTIPVTPGLVGSYVDYQHERDQVQADHGTYRDCDMVFVNLFREPRGAPLTYWSVKDHFDRLSRAGGFAVRPHMFRHTAATRWVRSGIAPDVVSNLLGHVSPSSLQPYLHVTDQDRRAAVERVAARSAAATGTSEDTTDGATR
jgi:integrase/recombinase XerD